MSNEYNGADLYLIVPQDSDALLSVTPADSGTSEPPSVTIVLPSGATNGVVRAAFVTNETSLAGLDTEALFLPEGTNGSTALKTALTGLADGNNTAAQQVVSTFAEAFRDTNADICIHSCRF